MDGGAQLGRETDWSNSSSQGDIHEDFCTVCRRSGQLLMCDTCSRVYHLDCLDPPLKTIPKGMWICPKCQDQVIAAAVILSQGEGVTAVQRGANQGQLLYLTVKTPGRLGLFNPL